MGSFSPAQLMALTVGDRLGHYNVTALIGEGGMEQVYRATDTQLGRDVALKILPDAFAADPDRLARFQREAHVLASLNHPNIAAIYGIERSEDTQALVLELVEGPTLADRISKGPIPLDEALPIAKQIAEALEAAHEAGVIHRDLKPANIKVREDGTVKVLDFGLAKALDPAREGDPSQSPTLTAAATQLGVIMGTAAYMSPEQARGKPVDKRSDIWAFGVVLYEMLTGTRPFQGEDVSLTLASVMKSDVNVQVLPAALPETLRTVIRQCLQKDPKRRIRDVGDLQLAMEGAFETAVSATAEPTAAPRLQLWQRPVPVALAVLLVAIITGLAVWSLTRPAPPPPALVTRFPIPLVAGQSFAPPGRQLVAISPDGSDVVYATTTGLWRRPVDQLEAIQVPGTEGAREPFFSANGQSIGFWTLGQLKKVSVSGGAPVTIADLPRNVGGFRWGADDRILFSQGSAGIWRVPGTGGTPEVVIEVGAGERAHGPQLLPGGEWVLFTLQSAGVGAWDLAQIVVESLVTGDRAVVIEGGRDARYVASGHLVYASNGVLLAVPFDVGSRQVTGGPVPLVDGVRMATGNPGAAAAHFSMSTNGSLVYLPGLTGGGGNTLVWVDREGGEEPLVGIDPGDYDSVRVSPDGARLALTRGSPRDIWTYDVARGTTSPVTTDASDDWVPLWTPDGQRLVFTSDRSLVSKAADGTGEADRVLARDGDLFADAWLPDGVTLVFTETTTGVGNMGVLSPEGEAEILRDTAASEGVGA